MTLMYSPMKPRPPARSQRVIGWSHGPKGKSLCESCVSFAGHFSFMASSLFPSPSPPSLSAVFCFPTDLHPLVSFLPPLFPSLSHLPPSLPQLLIFLPPPHRFLLPLSLLLFCFPPFLLVLFFIFPSQPFLSAPLPSSASSSSSLLTLFSAHSVPFISSFPSFLKSFLHYLLFFLL